MHAHSFATQKRTPAPSQILRGVAGSCAPVAGVETSSIKRSSSVRPAPRRLDSWYPWPGMGFSGLDKDVDWGNLVGGGPV
jgi:hypothetical protein